MTRLKLKTWVLAIAVWLPAFIGVASAQNKAGAAAGWPQLKFEKYKLQNGLEVILSEDHRLPLVAANVYYHVGPAYEKPGSTGFAHLFEHMMFQGSKNVGEKAHIRYLEAAGASDINGTTNFDRTDYYETVPSNQLDLALWLESDRMGFLLETLDGPKLVNQRDVVRNERREGENSPYDLVEEQMYQAVFPAGHPYHGVVIGSHADIESARLNDVREFFRQYYTPNNASLAIVGDFDPKTIKATVEKYFGPIPSGPAVPPVNVAMPVITQEKRLTVTDDVELPRVYMAWLTAPVFKPGSAEANLLGRIIAGGKSSRLYKKLVYEKQIAQDVGAQVEVAQMGSLWNLQATCKPGVKPEAVEQAIDEVLADLRAHGPTQAEVDGARNTIQTQIVERLERMGGVADVLSRYNHYTGDPGLLDWDLSRYDAITPADLKKAMATTFSNSARVVVFGVPGKKVIDDVPRSTEQEKASTVASLNIPGQDWRRTPPVAGPLPKFELPVPTQFKLENGLTVLLVEQHNLPLVAARLLALGGSGGNPADKPGLAGFTAAMMNEGTTHRSALELADDVDQLGAKLETNVTPDVSFVATQVLKRNVAADFDLVSDTVLHPLFSDKDIERLRNQRQASLTQIKDDPFALAQRVEMRAIYGANHPYGYPDLGSEAALKNIQRSDLEKMWSSEFAPGNSALVIAGDLTETEARNLANKYFAVWNAAGQRSQPPTFDTSLERHILLVDKPGTPQTALAVTALGAPRSTADYAPLEVANAALGGLFSSRINMNLREKNGYTYGAFSWFDYRRGPGPFTIFSSVRTETTAPALKEIFSEIQKFDAAPVTAAELATAKDSIARSLAGQFETMPVTVQSTTALFVYELPPDFYRKLPAAVDAVTAAGVQRVANRYLVPEKMVVVAVGDRQKIEEGLKASRLGSVVPTSFEGEPIVAGSASRK